MDLPIVGTGDHVWKVHRPFGPSLGGPGPGNVSHVAVDSRDRVYLYRRGDPPVVVTAPDGSVIDTWGSGLLLDAHGIYISPDDTVFLVDRDAHEVLAFDARGNVKLRIGNRGRPALQTPFNHPADVAVSPETGDIYVADGYGNSAVHRFSADGRHMRSWGEPGDGPAPARDDDLLARLDLRQQSRQLGLGFVDVDDGHRRPPGMAPRFGQIGG